MIGHHVTGAALAAVNAIVFAVKDRNTSDNTYSSSYDRYGTDPYEQNPLLKYIDSIPDDLTIALWLGLAAMFVGALCLVFYYRWRGLRAKMFEKTPAVESLEKPGLLATNLEVTRWVGAFKTALEKAKQGLARNDTDIAREASAAMTDALTEADGLAALTHKTAVRVLQTGALQSFLVKVKERTVYVLVFPGRHEHSGLFRRYEPLTDGWIEHVSRLRRSLAAGQLSGSLLCVLCFLSSQAREGALLVAYEGEKTRLVPGDMVPENGSENGDTIRLSDKYDFQLA